MADHVTADHDALYWAREKARCHDDFPYLAQTYLHIKAKTIIGFPTLRLRRIQRFVHEKAQAQWKRDGWIRQVLGKARQVGQSTYWRARSFHEYAFKPHRNAFFCNYDEPNTLEVFEIDHAFYGALPGPLQPMYKHSSRLRMVFPGLNSKCITGHAKNINVGASQMNHVVHLTEVARYGDAAPMIQSSLFPSISAAKGADHSLVVLESTSQYGGEWFKGFAEAARDGENEFEFHFIPYFWHEDYATQVPRGFELSHQEREWLREFGRVTPTSPWPLRLENLVWRRQESAKYRANPALFACSFPHNWTESWSLPEGTLRVFTDDILEPMRAGLKPGKRHEVTSVGLEPSLGGRIEVWQLPEDGQFYDLGIDVSESRPDASGRMDYADWTVLEVTRRDTLEQVAEARLHIDPTSPDFLDLAYWLGRAYNTAQINPDVTGGWGMALLSELTRRGYGNLWRWRRRDDARERVSTRQGFLFTQRDKDFLVTNAVGLTARGGVVIHSEVLWQEMRSYLNVSLMQYGAAPGAHDDAVSAYMLALLAARDERVEMPSEPPQNEPPKPPSWQMHDIEADLEGPQREGLVLTPWRA